MKNKMNENFQAGFKSEAALTSKNTSTAKIASIKVGSKCSCGGTMKWYDGCLGYESIQCDNCHKDVNEVSAKQGGNKEAYDKFLKDTAPQPTGTKPYVPGSTKLPESPYDVFPLITSNGPRKKDKKVHSFEILHRSSGVSTKYGIESYAKAVAEHSLSDRQTEMIMSEAKKQGYIRTKRGALYRRSKTGKKVYKLKTPHSI